MEDMGLEENTNSPNNKPKEVVINIPAVNYKDPINNPDRAKAGTLDLRGVELPKIKE